MRERCAQVQVHVAAVRYQWDVQLHTYTLHEHSVEVSSEWHCPGMMSCILGEWPVELLAGEGMDSGPAVFTVVL